MHPTPNELSQLHNSRVLSLLGYLILQFESQKKVCISFQKHFRRPKDWEHVLLKIYYGQFHVLLGETVWVTCPLLPLILCVFIFCVPSTRYLSNCCDVSRLALLRKRSSPLPYHYHHCKDVWALWTWESADLVSGPQPATADWGDYVLCKTLAGSVRDFCCSAGLYWIEKIKMKAGVCQVEAFLCAWGTLQGPGDKSPCAKSDVEMCSGAYLFLCRTTAPVRAWMEWPPVRAVAWDRNSPWHASLELG